MKIILDAGHAVEGAVGARGNGYKEEVEARKIVDSLANKLRQQGHTVYIASCDKEKDDNKQLKKIVEKANKVQADLFVSIHLNSFADPKANGVEVYSLGKSGTSHTYACKIQEELVKLGYYDRKKKEANFYVLRHTTAPAVLVETGFITNAADMKRYNVDKVSEAILKGITGTSSKPNVIFRVVAGSYSDRKNAENMMKLLESKGIKSFIDIINK